MYAFFFFFSRVERMWVYGIIKEKNKCESVISVEYGAMEHTVDIHVL